MYVLCLIWKGASSHVMCMIVPCDDVSAAVVLHTLLTRINSTAAQYVYTYTFPKWLHAYRGNTKNKNDVINILKYNIQGYTFPGKCPIVSVHYMYYIKRNARRVYYVTFIKTATSMLNVLRGVGCHRPYTCVHTYSIHTFPQWVIWSL